jgi:hypothetical protein
MLQDIYITDNDESQIKNILDNNIIMHYSKTRLLEDLMLNYIADTYFNEIKDYNKDIVSFKQSFFQNVDINDLKNLLHILSYNIQFNSTNYRWGKRFFSKDQRRLTWMSDTNKQIQAKFWSHENHQMENYWKNIKFTDDMISDHFLSCYKCNRKVSFYYKLSETAKAELKDYEKALINLYKIDGKTYGASQRMYTDVLLIDIDNYEERHSLETLGLLLDYLQISTEDLMVLEQNVFTGGLHTAIKLPYVIDNLEVYSEIMTHLKEIDIKIECNFMNNFLRLPLSYEYVAIKKTDKIFMFDEFIPESLWEQSFEEYFKNINLNPCKSEVLDSLLQKDEPDNKWKNYWKTSKTRFYTKNTSNLRKAFKVYDITKGNRYKTLSKIIPMLKALGCSLDETVDIIKEHNVDSKDLAKWSKSKLKKNIEGFYNKCNLSINVKKRSYRGFISNIDKLPIQTLNFLSSDDFRDNIVKKFISYYLRERNKDGLRLNDLSKEKKDILYKIIPYMIQEIIGSMFYHIDHKKLTTIQERIGYQLSDEYLMRLQDKAINDLNIVNQHGLAKTSLQYLKRAIIKSLSLKEINYKNRKRNWLNGSCKSYEVNCLNDLYNLLQHLFNSIKGTTFQSDAPSNILYISLGRKQQLLENDDFNIHKKMIDIDDCG